MISVIVAVADNGVIGAQGMMMPWHLGADLARFKKLTLGHPIIMGRKTYETIGRPLPGRTNIVISRNIDYEANGCTVVDSIQAALEQAQAKDSSEVFVIGGATIFKAVMPLADRLYLTQVHGRPEGDVYFNYNPADWRQESSLEIAADRRNDYPTNFKVFFKK